MSKETMNALTAAEAKYSRVKGDMHNALMGLVARTSPVFFDLVDEYRKADAEYKAARIAHRDALNA